MNSVLQSRSAHLFGGSAMPPELPAEMPNQSLSHISNGFPRVPANASALQSNIRKRWLVIGSAILLSVFAIHEMRAVFLVGGLTAVEYLVLLLFAVNFCWIALAFCSSVVGFVSLLFPPASRDEDQGIIRGRTAVLMPTYNEAPDRVFSAVETMALMLHKQGHGYAFDWFILSDTNDPKVALAEEQAFALLREEVTGRAQVFYRRRHKNLARKSGNVADFCRRWGSHYQHLLVLDADSLMETHTMVSLVQRMEADPDAGLIQTIPSLVRGSTLLARLQQFAARFYGPVIGTGLSWWVQNEGNFWGHNAIIRTEAFMKAAGLPQLSGKPPFGGHIMSHDFVEAALIRRAGWSVKIAADLPGSYEECPPSIIDMAIRDRRWCQGNLQHSRVLPTKGLHWVSRMHLMTGIMAYLSSPLWLLLILSGLLLALQAHFIRPEYFTDQFSLFPTWPVMDADRALRLFYITMGVLFGPKVFGLLLLLRDSALCKDLGGRLRIAYSSLTEVLLSAMIAPIMMFIHCGAVLSILSGRDSGWSPQRRDDGSLPWKALIYRHRWHMIAGLLLGYAAILDSLTLLAWMAPALLGLWFAVPLSAFTASKMVGQYCKDHKILATPEEVNEPAVIRAASSRREVYAERLQSGWDLPLLLREPSLMTLHLSMLDTPPLGANDLEPLAAMVRVKVQDAKSQHSLLEQLTPQELGFLIGHRQLLAKVTSLPPMDNESAESVTQIHASNEGMAVAVGQL